jgi:SAM-dependent MidA family methyltransferase
VIDYADPVASLLARGPHGPSGWLRTYRTHHRGDDPLDAPGEHDITCDLTLEGLRRAAHDAGLRVRTERTQAEWLRDLGVEELVEAGKQTWTDRAHLGDLDAIAARSRTVEAAALTDPSGLGSHRVVVFTRL